MAQNSPSRRLIKLADQIEHTEFAWAPAFETRPDQITSRSLPFREIVEDIHAWLAKDEVMRYATEPAGSDYFERAWKNTGEFKKTRTYFKYDDAGLTAKFHAGLFYGDFDEAKNAVAKAEHYLNCFRHALQYQYECADAARAYASNIANEHHNELIPLVPLSPGDLEEKLDLHLIEVGKYDPLLKHHIHAACHNAVRVAGTTPDEVLNATFDATKFDRYFAKLQAHLRTNINTLGDMMKHLTRFRERIDEIAQDGPQRHR